MPETRQSRYWPSLAGFRIGCYWPSAGDPILELVGWLGGRDVPQGDEENPVKKLKSVWTVLYITNQYQP